MQALRRLTTLTALTAAAWFGQAAIAPAAQFDQRSIPADRVVAVAEPVDNGRFYNLLIIEQISNVRQCWEEQGSSPTVVNPLLLSFNFTGICGRSSDSNGYSVRVGGEDTRYRLQVVQRQDALVLIASPSPLQRNLPSFEIGRTSGLADGFLKIELNPGWQMARRVYNGQPLGHIYLANEQSLDAIVAAAGGSPPPRPAPLTPAQPERPSVLPAPPSSGRPLPAPGADSEQGDFKVVVSGSSEIIRRRVQAVEPSAFRATVNGESVIQAGRFRERSRAQELQQRLARADLPARIVEGSGLAPAPPPSSPAPSGELYYQVVVPGSSDIIRARVNAVEPGAFRTTVNGESVIQAGRFRERDRAESLQRRLSREGLTAQIIQGRGAIATPAPRPAPQGRIVVMIDPGHGGRDPGAVGIGGLREKDINIWVAQRVQQRLAEQGIQALMTRSDDRELDLQPRVNIAERANATLFVSIHANAISLNRPDVNGLETYYYSSGVNLARAIHNSVLRNTDMRDRGVRRARFYVLRNTSMPAVLVETGFVTGREDAARFRNLAERQDIADGIADGILSYLRQTSQL
ncbi:MAG: DUF3747 domain-containing protein [Leptolyngbya sp. SIO4C1]|nr:DUF3747 domain-containing protein [Leptolyngbya sp. SIO4C1]